MTRAEELATAHAGYIRELLDAHGVVGHTIEQCMFHYKTAFVHGYKHGVEDSETDNTVMAQANAVISKDCLDMGHLRTGRVFNDGPGYQSSFTGKAGAILSNIDRKLGMVKIDTTTGVNEMFEDEYKRLPEIGHEVLIAVRYRDGGIYKAIGAYIRRGEREAEDFFDGSWADDQVETIDGVEYVRPGWFAVSLDHDPAYAFANGDMVGWMPLPEFGDGTGWNRIEDAKKSTTPP